MPIPRRLNRGRIELWTAFILWAALVAAGFFWFQTPAGDRAPHIFQKEQYDVFLGEPADPLGSVKLLVGVARGCYPWLIFLPVITALGWHFRFERSSWYKALPIHIVASLGLSFAAAQWTEHWHLDSVPPKQIQLLPPKLDQAGGVPPAQAGKPDWVSTFVRVLYQRADAVIYWLVVASTQAVYFSRRARERERQAIEFSARLSEARLEALRTQFQPHFLFNALNAVSALIPMNPAAAQEALNSLAELLRASLNISDRPQIALREELDFLAKYLEIQKIRFGERLAVQLDVRPDVVGCLAPSLFLQPLVENSIKHGLDNSTSGILIRITAARAGETLSVRVEDNGPEITKPVANGVGLENLRRRLEMLYPGNHRLTASPIPDGGFRVTMQIPFREQLTEK